MSAVLFAPTMLGGAIESRYRRMRPEIELLPWGALRGKSPDASLAEIARRSWTIGAWLEQRAAAAAASLVRTLIEAGAPLDLVCVATRFPLDEMVHSELCARVANELGGGIDLRYRPDYVLDDPPRDLPPLARALELVVRYFCVGESISLPIVRAQRDAATEPLSRAVFETLVHDDSTHATFGWEVLDWAIAERSEETAAALERLSWVAGDALRRAVGDLRPPEQEDCLETHPWLESIGLIAPHAYAVATHRALHERVAVPLRERGIAAAIPAGWDRADGSRTRTRR